MTSDFRTPNRIREALLRIQGKGSIFKERRTTNDERKKYQVSTIAGYFPILLLLFSLLFFPAGCAHLSPDVGPENVAPFFHIQTDTENQSRRLDAAGPFYSQSESPEEREWTFRPFFSYRENLKEETEELEYLYPLGRVRKTPEGKLSRFIPFYSSFKPSLEKRKRTKERMWTFSLFFGERVRTGAPYGGFFPFGGVFRDRFDRDEIQFVLWPLYSRILEDETETDHFLWPIFSLTSGGDAQRVPDLALFRSGGTGRAGGLSKDFFPLAHRSIIKKIISIPITPRPLFIFSPCTFPKRVPTKTKPYCFGLFLIFTPKTILTILKWISPGRSFNMPGVKIPWPLSSCPSSPTVKQDQRERLFLALAYFLSGKRRRRRERRGPE